MGPPEVGLTDDVGVGGGRVGDAPAGGVGVGELMTIVVG